MSAKIGEFGNGNGAAPVGEVWASRSAIELTTYFSSPFNLEPLAARNLAALLLRAAEETERMRSIR